MTLKKLVENLEFRQVSIHKEGESPCDIEKLEIKDIKIDSRKVEEGDLFICIAGAESDGHDFVANAVKAGAKALIIENEEKTMSKLIESGLSLNDLAVIKVEDTKLALALVSESYFDYPHKKIKSVALTGTKGKTSTSFMIKSILEKHGHKVGVIGTMGWFIGEKNEHLINTTPDSYTINRILNMMVEEGCDVAVMEVSSQALMLKRTAGIVFDIGVFTNLSPDHIGENEHKDLDDYIFWKSTLFNQCKHAIANIDDECYDKMVEEGKGYDITSFGQDEKADLRCTDIRYVSKPGFIGVDITLDGVVKGDFEISSPGKFSAYNAMAAIAVASKFDVNNDDIKDALKNFHVRGRVEAVKVSDRFTLMIDYAHNAMSLESLLNTLKEYKPNRIVTLFGCGGNRSRDRRFQMGETSARLSDFTIVTSDNPRNEDPMAIIADIVTGIEKVGGNYATVPDRKDAIRYAILNAKDGDVIVLAGKGHEDYQEINGVKHHMDERELIGEVILEPEVKEVL